MAQVYSPTPVVPNNRQATTSLTSGIIAWVLWLLFICFNWSIGFVMGAFTGGITSILCGIASYAPVIPWIIAIVTGHIGLSQIARTNEGGKGMAVAGLIMGYVGLLMTLCTIVFAVLAVFGIIAAGSLPGGTFLTPVP
jgi:hypothetical protein